MRLTQWLILGILVLALIVVGVIVGPMLRPPWVEAVGTSVLRTNAPLAMIAEVEYAVVDRHRNYITDSDSKRSDPSYSDGASSWSTGPSPERKTAEVIRGHLNIADKDGHTISIERITSTGMPAHIFVEFDGPEGPQSIVSELLFEFEKVGVRVK